MPERRLQRRLTQPQPSEPPVVGKGPLIPSAPHGPVAQEELRQAVPRPGAVGHAFRECERDLERAERDAVGKGRVDNLQEPVLTCPEGPVTASGRYGH